MFFFYVQQSLITLKVVLLIYKREVDCLIWYNKPQKMFKHTIFVLFTSILLQQVTIKTDRTTTDQSFPSAASSVDFG